MSVEPNSDATTRVEIASLDRIRKSPQRFLDTKTCWTRFAQILWSDGGGCLESDGDGQVKQHSNETAIRALPCIAAFTLQAASFG
jgi:hypothetical protein